MNCKLTGYNKHLALTSRTTDESEVQFTSSTINTTTNKKQKHKKITANPWTKRVAEEVNYIREAADSNIYRVLGSQEAKSLTVSN
jgi:hypothetical protein